MSSTVQRGTGIGPASIQRTTAQIGLLNHTAAAFGLVCSTAIVFNTVLACIKRTYDPLNSLMASLTGHHWITSPPPR